MTCTPFTATAAASPAMGLRAWIGGLDTWLAGSRAHWGTGSAGAWQRGVTPFQVAGDLSRWWEETSNRRAPEWATQNRVVLECPRVRLRDFSDGGETCVVPTLLVPPQAGHASCIVDYSPAQSQVKTARAARAHAALLARMGGATQETKDAGIEHIGARST
jgi:poly(3-hydroxybutyrate) depolymerase